jgi:hypothetical protein
MYPQPYLIGVDSLGMLSAVLNVIFYQYGGSTSVGPTMPTYPILSYTLIKQNSTTIFLYNSVKPLHPKGPAISLTHNASLPSVYQLIRNHAWFVSLLSLPSPLLQLPLTAQFSIQNRCQIINVLIMWKSNSHILLIGSGGGIGNNRWQLMY